MSELLKNGRMFFMMVFLLLLFRYTFDLSTNIFWMLYTISVLIYVIMTILAVKFRNIEL